MPEHDNPVPPPIPPVLPELELSLCGRSHALPKELFDPLARLKVATGLDTFLLLQRSEDGSPLEDLDDPLYALCYGTKAALKKGQQVALVIHSPGGSAMVAYKLAKMLRRHCGGYIALIPKYAKSAATLLTLGARSIYLGQMAELGPLDVQIWDSEQEGYMSALDEVQALDRLNTFAMDAIHAGVLMHMTRSGRKLANVLPGVQHYVAEMLKPLFDKVDTVHYTRMSRLLTVAEEYAVRLLQPKYSEPHARTIAHDLVHSYPDHRFIIDISEAKRIKLKVEQPSEDLSVILEEIWIHSDKQNLVGLVVPKP